METHTDGHSSDDGILDQAQQKAGQVVEQVQEKAGQVADQARQQATTQLDTQRERVGGTLQTVADAIRQTGRQLRDQDQEPIAAYADRAADQVERFYNYLGSRNVNEIVGDVERLARREPALFLGAAFAVGLLATRFLKSSGQQAQQQRMGYTAGRSEANGYGGYSGRLSAGATGQGYGNDPGRGTGYDRSGYGAGVSDYGTGTSGYNPAGAGYGTGATRNTGYGAGAAGGSAYGAGTGDAASGYGIAGAGGSTPYSGTDYTADVSNAAGMIYGEPTIAPVDTNGGALSSGETGRRSDATDQG